MTSATNPQGDPIEYPIPGAPGVSMKIKFTSKEDNQAVSQAFVEHLRELYGSSSNGTVDVQRDGGIFGGPSQ